MGEKALKSGNKFQKMLIPIFDSLGYSVIESNIDITCHDRTHKGEKGNPRRTHGIDLILVSRCKKESNRKILFASPKRSSPDTTEHVINGHYEDVKCLNESIKKGEIPNIKEKVVFVWIISEKLSPMSEDIRARKPESYIDITLTTGEELVWLQKIASRIKGLEKKGNIYFYQPKFSEAFHKYVLPKWIATRLYIYLLKPTTDGSSEIFMFVFQKKSVTSLDVEEILNTVAPLPIKELIIHGGNGFNAGIKSSVKRINDELNSRDRPEQNIRKVVIISEDMINPMQYPDKSDIWSWDPL